MDVASNDRYIEVLDRVLDKGIVIDAWMRVAGIDLIDIDAKIVVVSIETYLTHSEALAGMRLVSAPRSTKLVGRNRKKKAVA